MGPPRFELGSPAPQASQFSVQPIIRYSELRDDLIQWFKGKIAEKTWRSYISILDKTIRFTVITTPEQLREIYDSLEKNKANFSKAVRNLLNFMVEKKLIDRYNAEEFKAALPIPKAKTDKKIPVIRAIIEADRFFRAHLNENYYLVFQLMLYSGLRMDHIVDMLNTFDPDKLEIFEDRGFARYNMGEIGSENKEAYECYMPLWLAKKLLELFKKNGGFNLGYDYAKKVIRYRYKVEIEGVTKQTLVSAKYIRKFVNNLLKKLGVPKDERNFILGRPSEIEKSIEFTNYLELREDADDYYAEVAPILTELMNSNPYKAEKLLKEIRRKRR